MKIINFSLLFIISHPVSTILLIITRCSPCFDFRTNLTSFFELKFILYIKHYMNLLLSCYDYLFN